MGIWVATETKVRWSRDSDSPILEADRKAPRKQRHRAHRIWQRIHEQNPDCQCPQVNAEQLREARRRSPGRGNSRNGASGKTVLGAFGVLVST
jgi:hypothetical protein